MQAQTPPRSTKKQQQQQQQQQQQRIVYMSASRRMVSPRTTVVLAVHLVVSLLFALPTLVPGSHTGPSALDAPAASRSRPNRLLLAVEQIEKSAGMNVESAAAGKDHHHQLLHRASQEQQQTMVARVVVHRRRRGAAFDTVQIAGSSLPDCSHACGSCSPCRLVMVSFVCASLTEAETCPMAYKCMCNSKSYPVP